MKNIGPLLPVLLALSFTSSAIAADLQPVTQEYLAVQEALAADQLPEAKAAATRLLKSVQSEAALASHAKEVSRASTIEEARNSFKALSEAMIAKNKGAFGPDSEVVSCSMAKARWIQKKGKIRNPYYGKSMLSCGERSS